MLNPEFDNAIVESNRNEVRQPDTGFNPVHIRGNEVTQPDYACAPMQ